MGIATIPALPDVADTLPATSPAEEHTGQEGAQARAVALYRNSIRPAAHLLFTRSGKFSLLEESVSRYLPYVASFIEEEKERGILVSKYIGMPQGASLHILRLMAFEAYKNGSDETLGEIVRRVALAFMLHENERGSSKMKEERRSVRQFRRSIRGWVAGNRRWYKDLNLVEEDNPDRIVVCDSNTIYLRERRKTVSSMLSKLLRNGRVTDHRGIMLIVPNMFADVLAMRVYSDLREYDKHAIAKTSKPDIRALQIKWRGGEVQVLSYSQWQAYRTGELAHERYSIERDRQGLCQMARNPIDAARVVSEMHVELGLPLRSRKTGDSHLNSHTNLHHKRR